MRDEVTPPRCRLSVIIPFHNRLQYLAAALKSVRDDLVPDSEIILVDDGSSASFRKADVPVKFVRLPRSRGPAAARNAGLEVARGEFITFFDSDDLLLPGAMKARLDYLEAHPEEIAVGGYVKDLIDPQGNYLGPYEKIHFYDVKYPPYRLSRDFLLAHRSLPIHLWLLIFRREAFSEIGTLDPWLRCGEDFDFFCRLLQRHTVPFIDCPVAKYRIHEENLSIRRTSAGFESTQTAVASQFLICQKHGLPLKESPFLMEKHFKIYDLGITLRHADDPVGRKIETEFSQWEVEKGAPEYAKLQITSGVSPEALPEKAIRTRYWEEFRSFQYRKENTVYDLLADNYFAEKNYDGMQARATYKTLDPMTAQLIGSAFKWMVIKGLEKAGFGYVHGSCVNQNGRQILFTGDPGSGKSSCLMRLIKAGAKVVCDDTLLFKKGLLYPFDHHPSIRGDFAERFHLKNREGLPEENCERAPVGACLKAVVFPRVWSSVNSDWREVSREEGYRRLLASYYKELDWNAYPEPEPQVRAVYETLLGQTPFFEFLAGRDEASADATLKKNCLPLLK